ncbi:MAG: hypothetical protein QW568_02995 [Candidatus Anstonellaceae archaeon]
MNRFAVLAEGFEHLSYPLGNCDSFDGQSLNFRKESYVLRKVDSEQHAHILVGSYDWLAEHASSPIGYVANKSNEIFVVCKTSSQGKIKASRLSASERTSFCRAVILRLAALHTQGFGCGGISAEAVEFSGREARLSNPVAIFALSDSDSLFYEAVATLRSLAGRGFAKKGEIESLAATYISYSPVCRHAVAEHCGKKAELHKTLAEKAGRFASYF